MAFLGDGLYVPDAVVLVPCVTRTVPVQIPRDNARKLRLPLAVDG